MEQGTNRLYPSAPVENNDFEQQFEKKLKDVNSFNNHINNTKERFTYFKGKNLESTKRF